MPWNQIQFDATIPVLKAWEEKLVVVRKEVKVVTKQFKATDEKAKALIRIVKENTKKV